MNSDAVSTEVREFLQKIGQEETRRDCETLIGMMQIHTGSPARLWGSMIGFGRVRYRYPTGTTGETFITGFAPRKAALTLYVLWYQVDDDPLLDSLGPHKRGKGCLYIKRLSDIDADILDQIIQRSATELDGRHIVEMLEG